MPTYIASYDISTQSSNYQAKRELTLKLFQRFNGGRKAIMVLESQYLITTELTASQMVSEVQKEFSQRAFSRGSGLLAFSNREQWEIKPNDKFLINGLENNDWGEINTFLSKS